MTAVCGGGTSAPKPGVNTSVYVDQTFVQSLLPSALSWLYPYLPFMQGLAVGDVSAFCAADPPTIPSLPTSAQFLSFITGGLISDYQTVNAFLQDITRAYLWYALCQCTSTTATPITPPSNPGTLPAINPPNIPPAGAGACLHLASPHFNITGFNQGAYMFPGALGVQATSGAVVEYQAFPASATSFSCTINTGPSDPSHSVNLTIAFYNAANAFSGVQQASPTTIGTPVTFTGSIPAGTIKFAVIISTAGSAVPPASSDISATIDFYCGGNSGGSAPAVPCCPPDATAVGLMQQSLALLTLLQRQLAPFAYVTKATHAGVSGSGQIAVQGLLGARVVVTASRSGSISADAGNPDAEFGLGWFNWGNADGWQPRQWLGADSNLSLPAAAGVYTLFGYSLAPGVVATVYELEREA